MAILSSEVPFDTKQELLEKLKVSMIVMYNGMTYMYIINGCQ